MLVFKWNPDYSVGVTEIDNQHKKLIDMIINLNKALADGKGKEVLGKLIKDLIDYTKTHFTLEEKLLEKAKYPMFDSHKKEHIAFVKKIEQFQIDFEKGKTLLTVEIMNFLKDWLKNHIVGTDKKYESYLKGKV